MIKSNSPWLMWGNTLTVTTQPGIAIANPDRQTTQLVKVAYKRPETWNFLFSCRVISADPVVATTAFVDFNVQTGLGRTVANIATQRTSVAQPGFERYVFFGAPLLPTAANAFKWSTSVSGPVRDDTVVPPATNAPNITNHIVGQDIQINVSIGYVAVGATAPLVLEVSAFLSPEVHIRPEWFRRIFPGGEDGSDTSQDWGGFMQGDNSE